MKRILLMVFAIALFSLQTMASGKPEKHTVKKGETLYSICRQYHIKLSELLEANPGLTAKSGIRIGQNISVPVLTADAKSTVRPVTPARPATVASTPETPYREEDIRVRNNPPDDNVAVASIGEDNPEPVRNTEVPAATAPSFSIRSNSANPDDYAALFNQYGAHGVKMAKNKGAANYLAETTTGNPYLALYNGAEAGTVLRVTNLMNKKTVYVKVVGRVPQADASREVIVKLSNQAAADLGAFDEKFLVEVTGVQPD
ncbi:MAG TPA: LysM peptidoglycan-binding domain-containing protein [Chitinophagales bacterium]|nr:LysM peptidoglycan-binding domain-containing protein [Chitinophagales bacterium]